MFLRGPKSLCYFTVIREEVDVKRIFARTFTTTCHRRVSAIRNARVQAAAVDDEHAYLTPRNLYIGVASHVSAEFEVVCLDP